MATEYELKNTFDLMHAKFRQGYSNHTVECPLAKWKHRDGHDKHPSARAKAGDPSVFMCFSCHSKGAVASIAYEYGKFSGDFRAYEYIKGIEKKGTDFKKKREYGESLKQRYSRDNEKFVKQEEKKREEISEERLQVFKQLVPKYALSRMTMEEVKKYEIGYNSQTKRMIIPIRDHKGVLVGFSGRDVTGEQKPKYLHAYGFRKEQYLYGEQWLDPSRSQGYGVEGFFDVIGITRFGLRNVMANMGTSYSQEQIEKIKKWFKVFIFLPDFDDKGQGLRCSEESGRNLLISNVRVGIVGVERNEGYVPRIKSGEWLDSDYQFKGIESLKGKDPGNWTLEDLKVAFANLHWLKL